MLLRGFVEVVTRFSTKRVRFLALEMLTRLPCTFKKRKTISSKGGRPEHIIQPRQPSAQCELRHASQNPVWIFDPSAVVFQFQGVGVTRENVSDLLRLAAVAEGHPSHLVGFHSVRKGGATAMLWPDLQLQVSGQVQFLSNPGNCRLQIRS